MKKAWIYRRKHVKGWWCGWYENGKRRAKALPTKALAEHFCYMKYTQLNSDVFTGAIDCEWSQMTGEYHHAKRVQGLVDDSVYEVLLTLRHFKRLVAPVSSKDINQRTLDQFILERGQEVERSTINKDIKNINAFLSWAEEKHYVDSGLRLKSLKVAQKPVVALSASQVRRLLTTAAAYPTLRLRILLAVTTGLRRGDIDALTIGDILVDRNAITTRSCKTKKAMAERPVPEEVINELVNHMAGLPERHTPLFTDRFSRKKWEKTRGGAGFANLKFHDLRKTFASLLAQRGVSTAVTQRLLEHSTPQLTNEVYTNVDPVLRQAVEKLPVAEWL
jgi:integrase